MILLTEIQILRNSIDRIQLFGLLNLIGCVVPKLTIKELFGVSSTGTSYSVNYVLKSVKVLGFTQKHQAAKLPSA